MSHVVPVGDTERVRPSDQLPPPASPTSPRSFGGGESALAPASESQAWIDDLSANGPERELAVESLRGLILKATRFEIDRCWESSSGLREDDRDDLANRSADDALVAVLDKLGEFRGTSRFTTWAYKFGLVEAGKGSAAARGGDATCRLSSIGRGSQTIAQSRGDEAETWGRLAALQEAIEHDLSRYQRDVLVATTLNDVPLDVLAERLGSTRGALYETIRDARRRLRVALAARGFAIDESVEASNP